MHQPEGDIQASFGRARFQRRQGRWQASFLDVAGRAKQEGLTVEELVFVVREYSCYGKLDETEGASRRGAEVFLHRKWFGLEGAARPSGRLLSSQCLVTRHLFVDGHTTIHWHSKQHVILPYERSNKIYTRRILS